jgi:hypothetical protein
MKKAKIVAFSLILLFLVLSTVASAAEKWPGWWKRNTDQHHSTTGTTGGAPNGTVTVPEPAVIALLGAGLVSLGIYAKRKRAKKQ